MGGAQRRAGLLAALLDDLGIDRAVRSATWDRRRPQCWPCIGSSPRRPCLLRGISLTDAAGDRRTHNQPGTYREYPNWQLPLLDAEGRAVLLSDLRASPRWRRWRRCSGWRRACRAVSCIHPRRG